MSAIRHAHAAEPEYFYIQHVMTGLFLTPLDARPDPGILVRGFAYDPERAGEAQLWTVTAGGQIANKSSRLVLEVADGSARPGARILQQPGQDSGGDRAKQLWNVTRDGRIRSLLQSPADDPLVLGLVGATSGSDATLEFETNPSQPRQCWRLIRSVLPNPSRFFIEHVRTGALLTPAQGELDPGVPLAVESALAPYPETQLWSWTGQDFLVNDASSLVADVEGGSASSGQVILWPGKDDEGGTANQRWTRTRDGRISSGLGDAWVLATSGSAESGRARLVHATDSPDEQWRVRRAVFPQPVSLARAVHLNGTNQAVTLDSPGPALADFTAEAWVRTSTGGPVITSRGATTDNTGLALGVNADGSLVFQVAGAAGLDNQPMVASVRTGPTEAADGEWHHLAGTRDGNTLTVYLDGMPVPPVEELVPASPLGVPPQQRLQFGVIRTGSGITARDWLDGDLTEIRLWNRSRTAAEIPAGMHHRVDDADPDLLGRWAFAGDSGHDSSLAHRHATLIAGPAFLDSDVEIVPRGDFYLVSQARLIQDYLHDPHDDADPVEIEGYRVALTIRDGDDQPAAGFITVALNNPTVTPSATLHFPDGTSTTLTPGRPQATLCTDAQGVVTFTMDAGGRLTCPMLRVQADFMTDGSWLVIAPDRQAHAGLAGITGDALRGRDANGDPIPGKQAPLPAHVDAATADATAQAIGQMMGSAVQHNAQADQPQMHLLDDLRATPRVRPYLARHQSPGLVAAGYDEGSDTIATHHIDRDAPVARLLAPENADHAHWAYDFTTYTRHTPDQAAREIRNLLSLNPVGDLATTLLPDFNPDHITGQTVHRVSSSLYGRVAEQNILTTTGGGLSWIKDHVAKAARIIVNTVETVIVDENKIEQKVKTLVITAVDAAERATYAVIQAVEHAVDVVAGFLEKLGSDIKAIVTFLKDLFRWRDVLTTQRIVHAYLRNLQPFVTEVMESAIDKAGGGIRDLRTSIDRQIEQWRDHLRAANAQSQVNSTAAGPPLDVKSTYVSHMTSANGKNVPVTALMTAASDPFEDLEKEWLAVLGHSWDDMSVTFHKSPVGNIHDVRSFFVNGVELVLNSLKALADGTLDTVEGLLEKLKKKVDAVLDALFRMADAEIPIPIVKPFYEKIVMEGNGEKLTLLGLASLIGAMGTTFAYKLATGHTSGPFTEAEADAFCKLGPEDYDWLVNPFAAEPRATAPTGPVLGERHDWIIATMALGGSVIAGVGTTGGNVVEYGTPPGLAARLSKVPNLGWSLIAAGGQIIQTFAELLAIYRTATEEELDDLELGVAISSVACSALSLASNGVVMWQSRNGRDSAWARWDVVVTVVSGVADYALGFCFYIAAKNKTSPDHLVELLNAISAAWQSVFQFPLWYRLSGDYADDEWGSTIVLYLSDAAGYTGIIVSNAALSVIYAKGWRDPLVNAPARGASRRLTPA